MIKIKKNEEWKTAFRTRYGNFKYRIIFFGLINISIFCQTMVNNTLAEYFDVFAVVYLDDILIYSKTLEKYIRHIKTILDKLRPSKKLDHKKIGPFFIKKQKGKLNYELDFPKEMKIYPVFHIFLLESANSETPVSTKLPKLSPGNEYKVEKIIDYDHRSQQYFVK